MQPNENGFVSENVNPPGITVKVSAYAQDSKIGVDTETSGCRFPNLNRPHLRTFLHDQSKRNRTGFSIARNIARAHGGDLVLSANGPEEIRFSFSLPFFNGRSGGSES